MKKVRALAAVGTAAPVAIGMTVTPATAHAAVTPHWRNCVNAGNTTQGTAHSTHASAYIQKSEHCVTYQQYLLYKYQTGLTERVRFWSNGKIIRSTWQAGWASGTTTLFSSSPDVFTPEMVCMALVDNNNHNKVEYGPLCVNT